MYIKKFTVTENMKKNNFYQGRTPVEVLKITSEYDLASQKPSKWTIEFKYLEDYYVDDFNLCNHFKYTEETVVINEAVSLNKAIKKAFSEEYWAECRPVVLIQPEKPYFYVDKTLGIIWADGGWRSRILPFMDWQGILCRSDLVLDAINYAKSHSIALPTEKDIKSLYNLLDYCCLKNWYIELDKTEYEKESARIQEEEKNNNTIYRVEE